MSTAVVAAPAPLAHEPMLEAIRAFTVRPEPRSEQLRLAPPAATIETAAAATETPPAPPRRVAWIEPTDSLWLLSLKNYGLTLATFGVYHFWGRAEMNRRMVNAIHVDDKPLDYTGTGREAFISFAMGAVIAASIVGAFLFVILSSAQAGASTMDGIRHFRWQRLTISLPLLFLLGSITYRRRHHILRRTWIGAERFALTGHAWSYAWRHFWSAFLIPLTAGWAAPWRSSMLEARKLSEMQLGTLRFQAAPDRRGLYKAFAVLWLGGGLVYVAALVGLSLMVGPQLMAAINGITLEPLKNAEVLAALAKVMAVAGLPMLTAALLYRKAWLEHQFSAIRFDGGGAVTLRLPTARFLGVALGGIALSIVSLGCFKPVARARYMRFIVDHLRVDGR